jgi:hypothetical protein
MYQAAIALHKCARAMCLPFSLCIITRINIVGTGLVIMVMVMHTLKNYGLGECTAHCAWQDWMSDV